MGSEEVIKPNTILIVDDTRENLTVIGHLLQPYHKEAFPLERAVSIITEGRGKHFDPDIVDAFLALMNEFVRIAERYTDHPEAPV